MSKKHLSKKPTPSIHLPIELMPVEAYDKYIDEARKLPSTAIQSCRADLPVVLFNVRSGVRAITPHAEKIAADMPNLQLTQLLDLPNLALAVLYASDNTTEIAAKGDVSAKLKSLRDLREPMLLVAEALGMMGLVSAARVAKIREGTGPYDAALDGIALDALYRDYADVLSGKHPFTQAMFVQITSDAKWLLQNITPAGARKMGSETATAERDQLWSLLVSRFPELRRVGFYLFGEAIDQHVPLLQSRDVVVARTPSDPPVVVPVAPASGTSVTSAAMNALPEAKAATSA